MKSHVKLSDHKPKVIDVKNLKKYFSKYDSLQSSESNKRSRQNSSRRQRRRFKINNLSDDEVNRFKNNTLFSEIKNTFELFGINPDIDINISYVEIESRGYINTNINDITSSLIINLSDDDINITLVGKIYLKQANNEITSVSREVLKKHSAIVLNYNETISSTYHIGKYDIKMNDRVQEKGRRVLLPIDNITKVLMIDYINYEKVNKEFSVATNTMLKQINSIKSAGTAKRNMDNIRKLTNKDDKNNEIAKKITIEKDKDISNLSLDEYLDED